MPTSTTDKRSRGDATREALISAAVTVFSQDGFHAASTRAIAEVAGVPQALIGYHFHGKEGLYLAVFEHITSQLRARLGPVADAIEEALGKAPKGTSKAALRERHLDLVLQMVENALAFMVRDESARWAPLIVREQREPTQAFSILYEGFMKRMLDLLTRLVSSVRGDSNDADARLAVVSIMGQMLVFRLGRTAVLRHLGWTTIGDLELTVIRSHLRRTISAQLSMPASRQRDRVAGASGKRKR